ncbi:MAG: hypothetical protein KAH68_00065 [Draconibacterium sp.]|nr:hypothetical protein [Draconibacterium sp.]
MQRVVLLLMVFFFFSCGTQKKLQKSYVGQPSFVLIENFGNPKVILDRENAKIYVFEKILLLKSTEISQGKLTLDPMVSPMVQKTELFYFTIKDNIITEVKVEEEYKR